MALQATSHLPADADDDPDHVRQPVVAAAPPFPPAGGEGCPKAVAVLPDDIHLEILSRLPVKLLFRFKCVSKAWFGLIADVLRTLSPTLQGFFYYSNNDHQRRFLNLLGASVPPVDPSFSFLPKLPENEQIILVGSCNGLVLFRQIQRSEPFGKEQGYTVCNPATKEWVLVPSSGTQCGGKVGFITNHLIFDPVVSSGFKLVQFMFDSHFNVSQVHTYSSESRVWSGRSVECWAHETIDTCFRSAFVNGMLHLVVVILRSDDCRDVIIAVDGEGLKRKIISWPEDECGSLLFLGQSQGLLHCTSGHINDLGRITELLISVLEDYDTEQWIVKDTVSCLQLFGVDCCITDDSTIAFHPDHNLVFFFHLGKRKLVSYDMDSKVVSTLCTLDGWEPINPYFPYFVESSALVKNH